MIQNLTFDLLHIRGKWQIIEQLECMVTLVTNHLAKIGHMVYEIHPPSALVLIYQTQEKS